MPEQMVERFVWLPTLHLLVKLMLLWLYMVGALGLIRMVSEPVAHVSLWIMLGMWFAYVFVQVATMPDCTLHVRVEHTEEMWVAYDPSRLGVVGIGLTRDAAVRSAAHALAMDCIHRR